MAIEGDLEYMSLQSLIQVICLEQHKVALSLNREQERGMLFFDSGQIVHATAGPLQGEDAVYYLLSWEEGDFRVSNHIDSPRRTIMIPYDHLLLQAMKRIDDLRFGERTRTTKQTLSPADIERDSAMENELILLLSQLEQLGTRLAERKNHKRPQVILGTLVEMVNQLAAASGTWLSGSSASLSKVLTEISVQYPQAGLLKEKQEQLSKEALSNLYRSWAGNRSSRQETFEQVAQSLLGLLEHYFSTLVERFHSATVADQWRDTYQVFMNGLGTAIAQVRF